MVIVSLQYRFEATPKALTLLLQIQRVWFMCTISCEFLDVIVLVLGDDQVFLISSITRINTTLISSYFTHYLGK